MKILIGTNNQNKLAQFKRILIRLAPDVELLTLADLKIIDDVEEDGEDLLTNAKKKARFYGKKSGLMALGDDTGLFIDALDGEPGLHAKRWHQGTEQDRYLKILERMKEVPVEKRTCRYTGVLALYDPAKDSFWTYENKLEGRIATEPLPGAGFGYDPIVIIDEYDKYYSQLTDEERDNISHRGRGIRELLTNSTYLMETNYKNCQSCGMPMSKDPAGGGTNADGSKSTMYCSYCYQNGQFTSPEIDTPEKMQAFCKGKIKEMSPFMGLFAGLLVKGIPNLARWKKTV
jgi:XTP/dITP diphosphohydrolase